MPERPATMPALKSLPFSDLYLSSDVSQARMRSTLAKDGYRLLPVPEEYYNELRRLLMVVDSHVRAAEDASHFSVPFDDLVYRVQLIRDVRGPVYALRRSAGIVPALESCGIAAPVREYLLSLRSGLVLIAGGFGTGKTTAASSYVRELAVSGAMVITLEDPPELPLSGDHGEGRILQVQMNRRHVSEEIEDTLRMAFDALFISEIRTPLMANEVIKASISGKLIVSTIHSDSAANTVSRIIGMATESGAIGEKGVRETIANGLAAVVYMSKIAGPNETIRAATEYLIASQDTRGMIASGTYSSLQNVVNSTRNRLSAGQPIIMTR